MKRSALILFLGLACGIGAHFGWLSYSGAPRPTADLGAQLAWMRESLRLNDEQLARIRALHEQSAPRLQALAAKVENMRGELAAFEQERQSEGRIDFLEFARFVEARRQLDRECVLSTEALIAQAAEVMTARQREQYLGLLAPALKTLHADPSG